MVYAGRYFRVKWFLANFEKRYFLVVLLWKRGEGEFYESDDSSLMEKTRQSRRDASVTKKSEEQIGPGGPDRKNRERLATTRERQSERRKKKEGGLKVLPLQRSKAKEGGPAGRRRYK